MTPKEVYTKEAFIAKSREDFSELLGKKISVIYEKKIFTLSFVDEMGNKVAIKAYEFWPIIGGTVDPSVYSLKVAVNVDGIHSNNYEIHKKRGIEFGVTEEMYEPYSDIIDMLIKKFC